MENGVINECHLHIEGENSMNVDELLRGYSGQDEYIARDMMILEILINKGLVTPEDISKVFTPESLTDYIKIVREQRREQLKGLDKDDIV